MLFEYNTNFNERAKVNHELYDIREDVKKEDRIFKIHRGLKHIIQILDKQIHLFQRNWNA